MRLRGSCWAPRGLQLFGFGLAVTVLIDAMVVRRVLVPAAQVDEREPAAVG